MSRSLLQRLLLVLVGALVLWGVAAITRRSRQDRTIAFAIPHVDTAAVDTVSISSPHDTILLGRGPGGTWRVNDQAAAATEVNDLLRALVDTTAWGELVAQSAASQARLGVAADSAKRLRVASHGRTVLNLLTGKQTSDYGGVYVRRDGEDAVYALHGGFASALVRAPDDWRDKRIAGVAADSVATIEVQRGASRYTLRRSGKSWQVGAHADADSAAVARVLETYGDLRASGFATPAQADSADFRHPVRRTRIVSKSGGTLVSLVFDSSSSGVWTRADSGGTVFRLDAWMLDQLTPAESSFRKKRP
jgi:Domain of unknown function (DUF4340)